MSNRTYTQEEVSEILRRALERQRGQEGTAPADIDHRELLEIAREVGIPSADVEAVASQLGESREIEHERKEMRRARVRGFTRHLSVFVLVNLFLFAIDLLTTGGIWFFFPLLSWGLGLSLHGSAVAFAGEEPEEKVRARLERRAEKRRQREEREARRRRRKEAMDTLERGAREFEHAVTRGTGALLGVIAQRLQQHLDERQSPPGQASAPAGLPRIERPRLEIDQPVGEPAEVSVGADRQRERGPRR